MKKVILKKLLQILDDLEQEGISLSDAQKQTLQIMKQEGYHIAEAEIGDVLELLVEYQGIRISSIGMDLGAVPTVFARASVHSDLEALAVFEIFAHNPHIQAFYAKTLQDNRWMEEQELKSQLSRQVFDWQSQTRLYEKRSNQYRFQPELLKSLRRILEEYQSRPAFLISSTLLSRFALHLVPHMQSGEYRNQDRKMVSYDYLDEILAVIPKRGIPANRDVTKSLQSFYKDTLFHEFDHACPICGIAIPHMLIASHIKPFRDCAHIYEPIDHNNGMLLCRNHDYLFDQGYFSFQDDGTILFSDALKKYLPIDGFHLKTDYVLPQRYLSKERKAFLKYHRQEIFKK